MRLFVALNLPKKERERIFRAAAALRERGYPVRWLHLDHYHVTLKFLGEVREERAHEIRGAIREAARKTRCFHLRLRGFGAFPTLRRPRVLWVGVEPSPPLRCLKQDLEWALVGLGFERETRAFQPHLTIGRVGDREAAGAFRGLDEVARTLPYAGTVQIRTVDLMRSHLSASGARYTCLDSAPLAPPPRP